jgi:hypothetical protein
VAARREDVARSVACENAVDGSEESDSKGGTWNLLLAVPHEVDARGLWARAGLLLLFALWGMRLVSMDVESGEINSSFLHGPLLVFHEAGHVIFRPFGEFIAILGGTLGQLLMPMILSAALLKNRDAFGASLGLWFVGVSLLDVAPYLYDALQPKLMLLSGTTGEDGPHDWIYILDAVGLRNQAQMLGSFVHTLGAATLIVAVSWSAAALWKQYKTLADISR